MIIVSSLSKVGNVVRQFQPSHVASFLGSNHEMPSFDTVDTGKHLKLSFNDISAPRDGFVPPGNNDIVTFVDFVRDWDQTAPMVIHCWAGISRSTAGAFIARCALSPDESELEIAKTLRAASPSATPNWLMVALADEYLDREGRMSDAVDAIGRGADAWEGNVFQLSVS